TAPPLLAGGAPRAQPEGGADGDAGGDGQDPHAGAQGGIALEELEVLGDQEYEPREREEDDHDRAASGREPQVAKERDVQHRMRTPSLPGNEHRRSGGGEREADDRGCAGPASNGGLDDGQTQGAGGESGEDETNDIDGWSSRVPGRRHEQGGTDECHSGDGGHGDEDAAPPEVLEQPTAADRPEGNTQPGHAPPQPDGPGPLAPLGVQVGDDRQGGRKDDRGADPHHGPDRDQRARGVDEASDRGGAPEHRQPGEQGSLPSVPVAEASS